MKLNRLASLLIKLTYVLVTFVTLIFLVCYVSGPPELPDSYETVFYTDDGQPFAKSKENRKYIKLSDLNPQLISATIAVEDKHFYNHFGFDFKRIIRAVLKNIQHLSLKEGASTITQQYARNLYLTHDKTWKRKIKEAFHTIRLEMFYSKDEILEGYFNTIYYGHGAYGVEQASQYYFDKKTSELSLGQAALLAGVPKGPTYYSPFNDEERALSRQKHILSLLLKENKITKRDFEQAKDENLNLIESKQREITFAPYFTDYVLAEASSILEIDRENIYNSGYSIYTTLNNDLQTSLEHSINEQINKESDLEIGALALQPDSGEIRAMVGGRSYKNSAYNRAVHARRLVGSTIKPIVYYSALENGYTPNTMLKSEPTTFKIDDNKTYQPRNFNNYYANKPITLAQAIALSDNIYAVKTNLFLGAEEVIKTARTFGIKSELPEVPSLALGSASITVNEMVRAYGMISNGGRQIDSHSILKIEDHNGKTVYKRNRQNKQRLDPRKAFILSDLLSGMFDTRLNGHMEVTGASISHLLTQRYSGKSGTTETDSWMIGYSPTLVTGVWTGYDDNQEMSNMTEKKYAKEIWAQFMELAHQDKERKTMTVPQGVIAVPLDHETGKIATPHCPSNRITYFEKGTEPKQYCDAHQPPQKKKEKEEKENGFFRQIFDLFL